MNIGEREHQAPPVIVELGPDTAIMLTTIGRRLDLRLARRYAAGGPYFPTLAGFRLARSKVAEFTGKLLALAQGETGDAS